MTPLIEPTLTIAPPPWASMWRPNARAHQNRPLRLTSSTLSQRSSSMSSAAISLRAMPALLTRMSTRPSRATTASATSTARADDVTSCCSTIDVVALGREFGARPIQRRLIAIRDRDPGAGLGQGFSGRQTDAAGAAGDEGDTIGQPKAFEIHRVVAFVQI